MRNNKGQFVKGSIPDSLVPVGTIRIRTRNKRRGEKRAFIKVAEPNEWVLLCRHVWEQHNGPIPAGMGIHHKDRNKLNDSIENLELVSKADHVNEHRPEWEAKRIKAVRKATKGRTWSTKSKTKRTGRPAAYTPEAMEQAIAACLNGMRVPQASEEFGVTRSALHKRLSRLR